MFSFKTPSNARVVAQSTGPYVPGALVTPPANTPTTTTSTGQVSLGAPAGVSPSSSKQAAQAEANLFEAMLKQYKQADVLDDLARFVRERFDEAKRHRMSTHIDRDIMRSMRAVAGQYDPEDIPLTSGADVYINITNMKVRALKSWIADILANAEDQPWTLKPTPVPELPPEAEEAVIDALMREIQMYGFTIDLRERAGYFKDLALKHAMQLASEATGRMETRIHDVLTEGGWRETFSAFISDLAEYPMAVMHGPVAERVPGLRWKDGYLQPVDKLKWVMRRVHPLDFFPAPNAPSIQGGNYVIERRRMSAADVLGCKSVPGFSEEAVRKLVAERPDGVQEQINTDSERATMEATAGAQANLGADPLYDVLIYFGRIPGSVLTSAGVSCEDPQAHYESEVWVCAGYILKAVLNPHPLATRPYFSCSFEPVPGQIWGRGLPTLLRDVQRIANASARSLVRNMSYASGPIGEYDVERLTQETNINKVEPFRLYAVTSDPMPGQSNQAAIRFQQLKSIAGELMDVYERHSKIADDISGIPAYVLGNPQTAGAGRTLGGLSLLMGNAAKGVKHVIAGVDRFVIEPVITSIYIMMMLFDPDRTLKVDASVVARGSAGLLQRELQQARAHEVLQMLTPYAQAGYVPPDGLQIVIRDILRGLGYAADDILPDPKRQRELAAIVQQYAVDNQNPALQLAGSEGAGPAPRPSMTPGTAQPKLDRRSQPSGVDMATAENLPGNTGVSG